MPPYAYLFRHARSDAPSRRLEPLQEGFLHSFFLEIMDEIEMRRQGTPSQIALIVSREKNGTPRQAIFTTHGLRVSGITAFCQAGVPPAVIAEFLSGHFDVEMVAYYTKFGPATVTDLIDKALLSLTVDHRDATIGGSPVDALRARMFGETQTATVGLADANPAQFAVKPDGICPNGQSRCHEGGSVAGSKRPVPTPGGPRNCPLCRFWVTGPAFLAGQVIMVNGLLYSIRERAEALQAKYAQYRALPGDSPARSSVMHTIDSLEAEVDVMVRTLQARSRLVLRSVELARPAGDGDACRALIAPFAETVGFKEVGEVQFLNTVARSHEIFPEIGSSSAVLRRNVVLDRLLDREGFEAVLFKLSPDLAIWAGGELASLMIDVLGDDGLQRLEAGQVSLRDAGGDRIERFLRSEALRDPRIVGINLPGSAHDAPARIAMMPPGKKPEPA